MKRVLFFATVMEAQATIGCMGAVQVADDLWHYPGGSIVITGWGCQKAYSACLKYGHEGEIWNIGIAGGLRNHELGSLHRVASVGKAGQSPLFCSHEGVKLISSDVPIHDHKAREELGKEWDLVDMEGYGVALAAQEMGKVCVIWKLLSDFAKHESKSLILKNMRSNSQKLSLLMRDRGQSAV